MRWSLCLLCAAAVVTLVERASSGDVVPRPRVVLASGGSVLGVYSRTRVTRRRVKEFWSMPYARPPVQERRFAMPEPMEGWSGEVDGSTKPSPCIQYDHFGYSIHGKEDCLYINVFVPQRGEDEVESGRPPKEDDLMPVFVFIHGGAFNFLSGSGKSPRYLLDKDVLLVTFNYRLGPFGFLRLEEEGTVPGNLGLRDQRAALQWIQTNIRSFGGDPARVTIVGMSAGGASVHYHILSPLSKGLFQRAVSMSGTALNPWAQSEGMVDKTMTLAADLGCRGTSRSILACLRKKPARHLLQAATNRTKVWLYNPITAWGPSAEDEESVDAFLPGTPEQLIQRRLGSDVPWMVSFADLEGLYPAGEFLLNETHRQHLADNWDELLPHVLDYNLTTTEGSRDAASHRIKRFYLGDKSPASTEAVLPLLRMVSDRMFVAGIAEAALRHARHYHSPVFVYKFSYLGEDSVGKLMCDCQQPMEGASHGDDIGYVLESESPRLSSDKDLDISSHMVRLFHSFVTNGTPVFKETTIPDVKPFLPTLMHLEIGRQGSPYLVKETDSGQKSFWSSLGLREPALDSSTLRPSRSLDL